MAETLAEMTVDEFLQHGLDGEFSDDIDDKDEEDDDEEEAKMEAVVKPKVTNNTVKGKSKTDSKHKSQLESLKEKDPEFYKFLQENDEDLLAFSDSDADDNETDEDNEDNDDDADDDNNRGEDIAADDVVGDGDIKYDDHKDDAAVDESDQSEVEDGDEILDGENEAKQKTKSKKVTEEMLIRWAEGLEEQSLKSLKFVFRAFHAAVHSLSPDDEENKKKSPKSELKYSVDTGSMYNRLMKLCLKYSVGILNKNLTTAKLKKFTNTHLPSSHKSWSSIKVPLKHYLSDILQLLRIHTDVSALTFLLKHCQALCVFYACFPKISRMLVRRLIRMWSSGEEHVRVLAFLCIRTLSFLTPWQYEDIIKRLYIGFVRNSKFVNLKTKPIIVFMKNSLVEMFSYNEDATYRQGFLYIRQLAITLRNAICMKKKDSLQSVYNWQYISALQLWSQVVSDLHGEVLKPLVYPVVQINLGVIKLIPAARYYPLRFHCIESLNYISKKTGVYIPTASLVLQALESNEFLRKPKSSEKLPDFSGVLKLSKSHLRTKGFQDVTIDLAVESLLEHYVIFSNSIAFPELIFPVCHRLKHLIKTSHMFKLCKDMKTVVEKLQAHGDAVRMSRNQVTFSPKDIELVKQWEGERSSSKNVVTEFCETWQNMKKMTSSGSSYHDEEVEIPVEKREKSKNSKRKPKELKKEIPAKKKKTKKGDLAVSNNGEDIVEDYNLSDDDV